LRLVDFRLLLDGLDFAVDFGARGGDRVVVALRRLGLLGFFVVVLVARLIARAGDASVARCLPRRGRPFWRPGLVDPRAPIARESFVERSSAGLMLLVLGGDQARIFEGLLLLPNETGEAYRRG
jgi:hypothetical protein